MWKLPYFAQIKSGNSKKSCDYKFQSILRGSYDKFNFNLLPHKGHKGGHLVTKLYHMDE